MGRLMLANRPPLPDFQTQTAGGVYGVAVSVMQVPRVAIARRIRDFFGGGGALGLEFHTPITNGLYGRCRASESARHVPMP